MTKYFGSMGFWGRGFTLIFLTMAGMLISAGSAQISAYYIYGQENLVHPTIPVLQYMHAILSIGTFVVPPILLVILCCNTTLSEGLCINKAPKWKTIVLSIFLMLVSQPFVEYLTDLNLNLVLPDSLKPIENWMREKEASAQEMTQKLLSSPSAIVFAINIGVMALLPAIGEELYFRVTLQKLIITDKTRIGAIASALITAFIFSAIHLQFFGFLPRFVLGAALGLILAFSGNVWNCIAAHFANNALAIISSYIKATSQTVSIPAYLESTWMIILSALLSIITFFMIYKTEKIEKKICKSN